MRKAIPKAIDRVASEGCKTREIFQNLTKPTKSCKLGLYNDPNTSQKVQKSR